MTSVFALKKTDFHVLLLLLRTVPAAYQNFVYIYIYIYIYHIEGAVFTTIWCSMYKVQSVDSRNAEKEKTDSLLL